MIGVILLSFAVKMSENGSSGHIKFIIAVRFVKQISIQGLYTGTYSFTNCDILHNRLRQSVENDSRCYQILVLIWLGTTDLRRFLYKSNTENVRNIYCNCVCIGV